jgi:predicted Zn-dependent protease with MMP-like domain
MIAKMDWTHHNAPSLDDIESLAREAFASLPAEFRALAEGLVFLVQDFPDSDVMADMALTSEFDILGLFHGAELSHREGGGHAPHPTMVFLYRRPILDYWAENEETLGYIVRHVLIHEIGHYFGLSDAAMDAIEQSDQLNA